MRCDQESSDGCRARRTAGHHWLWIAFRVDWPSTSPYNRNGDPPHANPSSRRDPTVRGESLRTKWTATSEVSTRLVCIPQYVGS
jgi:hypothetical protein